MRLFVFGVFAASFALLPVAAAAATPAPVAPSPSPHVVMSPTSLTFSDGSTTPQVVTITNNGPGSITGVTISLSGGFALGGGSNCKAKLAASEHCSAEVTATAHGLKTGTFTISYNEPGTPPSVDLTILAPVPTPTPTPVPTPRGSIFLNPSSAPPSSKVTFSGSALDSNQVLGVFFDSTHVTDVNTDGSGNFSIQLAIPNDATGSSHQICVGESNGQVCAPFTLEAKPATPTPTDSATPTPSPSPSPSPSPLGAAVLPGSGGGSTLLEFLTRPPFVFLPIIAAVALLAFLGLYLWRVRPAPPIGEVTILHRPPPPRVYGEPDPSPPSPTPPAPPPAPRSPIVYESPSGPSTPPPPAPPPAPPSSADVPPEMPEASD